MTFQNGCCSTWILWSTINHHLLKQFPQPFSKASLSCSHPILLYCYFRTRIVQIWTTWIEPTKSQLDNLPIYKYSKKKLVRSSNHTACYRSIRRIKVLLPWIHTMKIIPKRNKKSIKRRVDLKVNLIEVSTPSRFHITRRKGTNFIQGKDLVLTNPRSCHIVSIQVCRC